MSQLDNTKYDVVIVGAGHNGLVSSILLAKEGLRVLVLEEKTVVGGCVKTEYPFEKAPNLAASTGAYLLGLMPPELMQKLGIKIPYIRRDPYYFLPTTQEGKYIIFGTNREEMKRQFIEYFSAQDWEAQLKLEAELDALREDIGQTWLQEPLSIEETAEKFVRSSHRQIFIDLCRKPIRDYIARFNFKSDLLKMMYAVTDGFSGLNAGWDSPGTGMNFLIHNMCRIPESGGTWMIVRGGMGEITKRLAIRAEELGVKIETDQLVTSVILSNGEARGVRLKNGSKVYSNVVISNADPFRMRDLIGKNNLPEDYNKKLDNYRRDGTTLKVMLAFKDLPKFKCLPENRGQYASTTHILPQKGDLIESMRKSYKDVQEGKLPEFPAIEVYMHSTVDPSIQDEKKRHSCALFVQWVPYELKGTTWEKEEKRYAQHLLKIMDEFAPGTSDLVEDIVVFTPPKLEKHFGITKGHIHHIDNSFGFADRLPYVTPIKGLYSCSAGTHPAGSVIGCGGHNSAMRILKDLNEKRLELMNSIPAKL